MRSTRPVVWTLLPLFLVGCEKMQDAGIVPEPKSPGVAAMQARSREMAEIRWTPLADVPSNTGAYEKKTTYSGIPYSSVKELDKFVGFDVSFKTFMTAVHNPRSLLYTEHVGKPPYKGKNCAAYYGTVCSAAVSYALGLKIPYSVSMTQNIPGMEALPSAGLEDLREGDVLMTSGHEVMVYQISRNADSTVKMVALLESAGTQTDIASYTATGFVSRWKKDNWTLFRYRYLEQNTTIPDNPFMADGTSARFSLYNDILCPDRGDECVYREGETAVLDILNSQYRFVDLSCDGALVGRRAVSNTGTVSFSGLSPGRYSVTASTDAGEVSEAVHFDVVDTKVAAHVEGDKILINYGSTYGTPEYISLCTDYGGRLITPFEVDDRNPGEAVTDFPANADVCYVKVHFSTPYGRVTNDPICLTKQ